MTINTNDIKALHIDMERVLDDANYVVRHFLKGQRKATHLVEQDIRHLRDHLRRLAKHLAQLQQLHLNRNHPTNNHVDDESNAAYGIVTPAAADNSTAKHIAPKR
jgi:DNA-binding transcriptional regulator GbsR (MarR family)